MFELIGRLDLVSAYDWHCLLVEKETQCWLEYSGTLKDLEHNALEKLHRSIMNDYTCDIVLNIILRRFPAKLGEATFIE